MLYELVYICSRSQDPASSQDSDNDPGQVVRNMSCALLQIQQMIEPKYLKTPLG